MGKSRMLPAIVTRWRNQHPGLKPRDALLSSLKQRLDDQRAEQLGALERAREEARHQEHTSGLGASQSLFPPASVPPVTAPPVARSPLAA
eukprot:2307623-Alexandrium_andersonii.AAC.1